MSHSNFLIEVLSSELLLSPLRNYFRIVTLIMHKMLASLGFLGSYPNVIPETITFPSNTRFQWPFCLRSEFKPKKMSA